jgi:hypothetical protein
VHTVVFHLVLYIDSSLKQRRRESSFGLSWEAIASGMLISEMITVIPEARSGQLGCQVERWKSELMNRSRDLSTKIERAAWSSA